MPFTCFRTVIEHLIRYHNRPSLSLGGEKRGGQGSLIVSGATLEDTGWFMFGKVERIRQAALSVFKSRSLHLSLASAANLAYSYSTSSCRRMCGCSLAPSLCLKIELEILCSLRFKLYSASGQL